MALDRQLGAYKANILHQISPLNLISKRELVPFFEEFDKVFDMALSHGYFDNPSILEASAIHKLIISKNPELRSMIDSSVAETSSDLASASSVRNVGFPSQPYTSSSTPTY